MSKQENILRRVIIELTLLSQHTDPKDEEMVHALRQSVYIFRELYQNRFKEGKQASGAKLTLVRGEGQE